MSERQIEERDERDRVMSERERERERDKVVAKSAFSYSGSINREGAQ